MSWKKLFGSLLNKIRQYLPAPRKRGFLVQSAAAASVMAVLLMGGYVHTNKSITLVVDGAETTIQTFAGTFEDAVLEQGIALQDQDEINPPVGTPLSNGMVVRVNRALDISITADGSVLAVRTRGRTVNDVLGEYNINLGPLDEVKPDKETSLAQDMKITVARVRQENVIIEEAVPFETINKYTISIPQGTTRVAQEGRDGAERKHWQVTYRDGSEVDRQLLSSEKISSPTEKVVMVGSGLVVSRGGENIRYSQELDMIASAYTYTGYNTASGVAPYYGVVAVDTTQIPMGTRMYVEGYGYATALDRGGSIKGNRIDLFFETYNQAMSWGVRKTKVYILN